jgi:hypothetical protein
MIGFDAYNPVKWVDDVMTIHVETRTTGRASNAKRPAGSWKAVLHASFVGLGMFAMSLSISEANIATGATAVLQRSIGGISSAGSEVPEGYWERLLARLQSARPLSEESLPDDPDPLA